MKFKSSYQRKDQEIELHSVEQKVYSDKEQLRLLPEHTTEMKLDLCKICYKDIKKPIITHFYSIDRFYSFLRHAAAKYIGLYTHTRTRKKFANASQNLSSNYFISLVFDSAAFSLAVDLAAFSLAAALAMVVGLMTLFGLNAFLIFHTAQAVPIPYPAASSPSLVTLPACSPYLE